MEYHVTVRTKHL